MTQLNEYEKAQLEREKLGFQPTMLVNVAGVVIGGQDRQDTLKKASVFVTASKTLTNVNDGVRLYRDAANAYDKWAIQVWLATWLENQRGTLHRMAGFIPRRVCTECWKSWGGDKRGYVACPHCRVGLVGKPMSNANQFLCENYIDKKLGFHYAVRWIAQANPRSHWGCQLAIGLPPAKVEPPK